MGQLLRSQSEYRLRSLGLHYLRLYPEHSIKFFKLIASYMVLTKSIPFQMLLRTSGSSKLMLWLLVKDRLSNTLLDIANYIIRRFFFISSYILVSISSSFHIIC